MKLICDNVYERPNPLYGSRRKKTILIGVAFIFNLVFLKYYCAKYNVSNSIQVAKIRKLNLEYVVVHLDLKGAPPTLNYIKSLLPKIKKRGANAVLMEYEDMFPYSQKLVSLSRPWCYDKEQLKQFLIKAHKLEIEVIPLVQTFGHMEFVLKLPEFRHLREEQKYSNSICPSRKGSLALIEDMLKQVIHFHNDVYPLKHIHIGCDEVYSLAKCSDCKARNVSQTTIMLDHVNKVVDIVRKLSPGTTALVWDDMLLNIKHFEWETQVKKIHFSNIEPVSWSYKPKPYVSHVKLRQYHLSFNNIWIATAFKGAEGARATYPNISNRFANHYNWMRSLIDYKFGGEASVYNFKGIILTGWSRYSHFQPLCELLPISLPSLFINLHAIKRFRAGFKASLEDDWNKMFSKYFSDDIETDLQCTIDLKDPNFSECKFDNVEFYKLMRRFTHFYERVYNLDRKTEVSCLKYYSQKNKTIFEYKLEEAISKYRGLELQLNEMKDGMFRYLKKIYDGPIAHEYVDYKTFEIDKKLQETLEILKGITHIGLVKYNM